MMVKRLTALGVPAVAALGLWLSTGCGPSTELIGTPIPNLPPSTQVTATPPTLIETGILVNFHWSGYDPDGQVVKFQWKISDNGTNGISVRDTLTLDPVTGDTLNPWFETTAMDSVFIVTADIPGFPGDPTGNYNHYPRSYQTHTFWIRAVDDKGAVDPTPAHVSFTATTLLPSVRITGPGSVPGQQNSHNNVGVPAAATFSFRGVDPDFISGIPTKYRYLWKVATYQGQPVNNANPFNNPNVDINELIDFEDSSWTDWRRYEPDAEKRLIRIDGLTPNRDIYYFLAVQVQDTAGAVSIGRQYGVQVANVRIVTDISPSLTVAERYLGYWPNMQGIRNFQSSDIAAGQELEFTWTATAEAYLGQIVSYQWGWDIGDPFDPDETNWAVQPGLTPDHMRTPRGTSLSSGIRILTVKVTDDSNQVTLFRMVLSVVTVPPRDDQSPVLLFDDVDDRITSIWTGQQGQILDLGVYRNAFWREALAGPGGVAEFNPDVDILEHASPRSAELTYRTAVDYKTLVWYTRSGPQVYVQSVFQPTFTSHTGDVDKYVWLVPYQEIVGNLLYAGHSSVLTHLASPGASSYETPIIFESREGQERSGLETVGPRTVRRGFGRRDVHGNTVWVGPTRYPFRTLGISVIDIMSSGGYVEYGTNQALNVRRKDTCVSMKGVAIDPDFKSRYIPAGGGFPDTIFTDPTIDWRDQTLPGSGGADILTRTMPAMWSLDEFYNTVVVARSTQYSIQQCSHAGYDGPCVEPMFRSISRFDWVRHMRRINDPEDTWPIGHYADTGGTGSWNLRLLCGVNALEDDLSSAITNDRTVGFIARKTAPNKPYPVGDVILGFDPYRFDNQHMTRVIQWVLGEHFGLDMMADDEAIRR